MAPILLVGTHCDMLKPGSCKARCESILRHIYRQDKSLLAQLLDEKVRVHRLHLISIISFHTQLLTSFIFVQVFAVSSYTLQGINELRAALFTTAMTHASRYTDGCTIARMGY